MLLSYVLSRTRRVSSTPRHGPLFLLSAEVLVLYIPHDGVFFKRSQARPGDGGYVENYAYK
jgi:hypothetical protein